MSKQFKCPQCDSVKTQAAYGTDQVWFCLNCNHIDSPDKFVPVTASVPVKYHQTISMKHLKEKKLYGGCQYDRT